MKTANKQYSSINNDYEMTFNSDTCIEVCDEQTDLPSISFDFVKIDQLESKQANTMIGWWNVTCFVLFYVFCLETLAEYYVESWTHIHIR